MSMRVHELAKELEKSNKDIINYLTEKKIEVKSHMSTLTDEQVDMVKKAMAGRPKAQGKPVAPAAAPEGAPKAEGTGSPARQRRLKRKRSLLCTMCTTARPASRIPGRRERQAAPEIRDPGLVSPRAEGAREFP